MKKILNLNSKNKFYLKLILWLFVLLWMILIFSLSSQNATESSTLSGQTIRKTAEIIIPNFKNMETLQQDNLISNMQYIVRKTAHIVAYLILGLLCNIALYQYKMKRKIRVITAFIICFIYSITDELHQYFVDGRSCEMTDILIDSIGVIIGLLIINVIINKLENKK